MIHFVYGLILEWLWDRACRRQDHAAMLRWWGHYHRWAAAELRAIRWDLARLRRWGL